MLLMLTSAFILSQPADAEDVWLEILKLDGVDLK